MRTIDYELLPCVRDENGTNDTWRIRDVFAKMDEEANEFKAEVLSSFGMDTLCGNCDSMPLEQRNRILDEWADMVIAGTSAVCAIIGASQGDMNSAIRAANRRNRERGGCNVFCHVCIV